MTNAHFHILLALYSAPCHGLGIADDVENHTGGSLKLGPGTLYRSLKELNRLGLVRPASPPADADPRRKFYSITERGRKRVEQEARIFERIVDVARTRQVLPEAR